LRLDRRRWAALAGLVLAKQDAKAHFEAGQTHYNLNEYVEALGEFKAACRPLPDPVFL
jgi:hypothetical protein